VFEPVTGAENLMRANAAEVSHWSKNASSASPSQSVAADGFLNHSPATESILPASTLDNVNLSLDEGDINGLSLDSGRQVITSQPIIRASLPPMGDGERRVLNVLVNDYLMARGYRATTLTLRDEVTGGQNLDDWSVLGTKPTGGEGLRLMLRRAKTLEVLDPTKLTVLELSNVELSRRCEQAVAAEEAATLNSKP